MDNVELVLKNDFLQAARDSLQSIEQSFLDLEKDPKNGLLIDAIFRLAHNLKGNSRAVGFGQIAELTHKAENLLLDIKYGKLQASPEIVTVLLSFNNKLQEMVEGLHRDLKAIFDCEDLMIRLDAIFQSGEADFKTSRSLGKLCKTIEDQSMSLRTVSIDRVFQKLNRVVRDMSKSLDKKVELRFVGEEIEIHKTIVEGLSDALVHILRNAIDHGIETPTERLVAGKDEVGIVEVMVSHERNFLVIKITDDGKGINSTRLMEKARVKGFIPQDQELSEQQCINLIFHPGLSIKDVASEVSGRGFGMDVVKTNIELLGGEVKVHSQVGTGSQLTLKVLHREVISIRMI